jgi:hypothetical protein
MLDEAGTPYNAWDDRTRWGVSQQPGGSPGAPAAVGATYSSLLNRFSSEERDNPAISGPSANPDGDDLTNFAEHCLGQDPRSGQRPQDWLLARIDQHNGQPHLVVEFRRTQNLLDAAITFESSPDGRTWSPVDMVEIDPPTPRGDGTESVRLRQPTPLTPDSPTSLIRLRFTQRP